MNDRISEFLKYLKIEKNYSSNTIKNYEIDIDEFKIFKLRRNRLFICGL